MMTLSSEIYYHSNLHVRMTRSRRSSEQFFLRKFNYIMQYVVHYHQKMPQLYPIYAFF